MQLRWARDNAVLAVAGNHESAALRRFDEVATGVLADDDLKDTGVARLVPMARRKRITVSGGGQSLSGSWT